MATPSAAPCAIIIFGSTGDLAQRKLLPALFALFRHARTAPASALIGFARGETDDAGLRARMRQAAVDAAGTGGLEEATWGRFAQGLFACQGAYDDPAAYVRLRTLLDTLDRERGLSGNRLFYLSVPPSSYATIVRGLSGAGLTPRGTGKSRTGWTRVIIEKPVGHDLASAIALNGELAGHLSEDQTYRIDHYLGKETVQNIIVLRFANGVFEPVWNRRYVDRVQITVAETLGIGSRGRFYEEAGALRDIVQNHLLQLLGLVAMEPPVSFDADTVRDETGKVFRAIRPIPADQVDHHAVRAQYVDGHAGGQAVPGYRQERNVAPDSVTETYVAMRLMIDNWRWAGVPFYLRTGKRLAKTVTEVAIRFTRVPHLLFRDVPEEQQRPNELVLRIQPDEGISLSFGAKAPGADLEIRPVTMDFSYAKSFGVEPTPAYERLILDAIKGDASLFIRADAVQETWRVVQPVLDGWSAKGKGPIPTYAAGTWGPAEADELMARDRRRWRNV